MGGWCWEVLIVIISKSTGYCNVCILTIQGENCYCCSTIRKKEGIDIATNIPKYNMFSEHIWRSLYSEWFILVQCKTVIHIYLYMRKSYDNYHISFACGIKKINHWHCFISDDLLQKYYFAIKLVVTFIYFYFRKFKLIVTLAKTSIEIYFII